MHQGLVGTSVGLGVDSGVLAALGPEEDQSGLASAPRPNVVSARLVRKDTDPVRKHREGCRGR